jgi:transcriptional regulator with XRE-family HTH domain
MNRLRQLRREKKLTLKEVSEKVNIGIDSISRMENNERGISDEYLRVFSDFYNVSTDYILGLTNIKNPTEFKSDELYLQIINEIKELGDFGITVFSEIKDYKKATKEQKEDLLKVIQMFKKNLK